MVALWPVRKTCHHYQIRSRDGDMEHDPLLLDRSPRCQYNLGVLGMPCLDIW